MKQRLKKILSIALTLSLVGAILGGIVPVKSYADITRNITVQQGQTATDQLSYDASAFTLVCDSGLTWVTISDPVSSLSSLEYTCTVTANATNVNPGNYTVSCHLEDSMFHANVGSVVININVTCTTHTYDWTASADGATHSYTCTVCGHVDSTHAADWSGWEPYQNGNHIHNCRHCELTETAAHTYENGVCTYCGAQQPSQPQAIEAATEPQYESEPVYVQPVAAQSQEPQVQDGDQGENANVETPIDKAQKLLQSQIILVLIRKQDVINSLKNKGATLDIGTWESLNKESYEKIDILLGNGIPVTIKYRYNNQYKEITIPATLKYKLADLCDVSGYLGLENLRGKLIADGYIKVETNDDEEMNIEIIDGIPMPVPKDPPKFEMKKLDVDGQVPSFDRLIGSQNNSNALPGTASLSAAGTTAATSPATSISKDTGSASEPNIAIAPANIEEWNDSIDSEIYGDIQNAIVSNTDYKIYVVSDGKLLTLTIKADSLLFWGNLIKIKDKVKEMVNEKKSITI